MFNVNKTPYNDTWEIAIKPMLGAIIISKACYANALDNIQGNPYAWYFEVVDICHNKTMKYNSRKFKFKLI